MSPVRAQVAAALITLTLVAPAVASPEDMLYRGEAVVTGQEMRERLRGFKLGAEEVLIKLTGRPKLAGTQTAKAIADKAADFVVEHSYEDRMKGIPVHDEQGTRDRPHFLRMRFDSEKFDRALADAGLRKWNGERPTVAVWLGVRDARKRYILDRSANQGYEQREVLKEASMRRAIPVILPEEDQEEVTLDDIEKSNWGVLLRASEKLGADTVLYGMLNFDGRAYWNVRWVMAGDGGYAKWRRNGVTFDQALKGAIDRVMSAHARAAKAKEEKR